MTIMADRAEMVLRSTHRHRLLTRSQCLRWLGSHFRVALDQTDHRTDYQVHPPLPFPPLPSVFAPACASSPAKQEYAIRCKFAALTP